MSDGSSECTTRVLAAVVTRADRVLVCQRPLHKRHGGLWEFPGGKAEQGESDLETARRELEEELDVRVTKVGKPRLELHDEGSEFLIAFVPVQFTGEPRCREHTALAWCTLDELRDLPLAPADTTFVRHLSTEPR